MLCGPGVVPLASQRHSYYQGTYLNRERRETTPKNVQSDAQRHNAQCPGGQTGEDVDDVLAWALLHIERVVWS